MVAAPRTDIINSFGTAPPWTGFEFQGSYQAGKTAYANVLGQFYVPTLTSSGAIGPTESSLWVGLDDVFQVIVWMYTNGQGGTYGTYASDRQIPGIPVVNIPPAPCFQTPAANDEMLAEVYYCDANGNVNLNGGFACSFLQDETGPGWACNCNLSPANTPAGGCASIPLQPSAIGSIGQFADFVFEADTGQYQSPGIDNNWPIFTPITMYGEAEVVQGGTTYSGTVTPATDPWVQEEYDWTLNVASHIDLSLVDGDEMQWTMSNWAAAGKGVYQTIVGIQSNLCLDVVGSATTAGSQAQMSTCTGSPTQLWSAAIGVPGLLINWASGLCLTGAGQGGGMTIQTCVGANTPASQLWVIAIQNSGQVGSQILQGNLCLNVIGGDTDPGSRLTLWPCQWNGNVESPNEVWVATAQSQIAGQQSSRCLNAAHGAKAGTPVSLFTCEMVPSEEWSLTARGELVQAASGLCITEAGQGNALTIQACTNSPNQLWTFNTQNEFVGQGSGQCINVAGGQTGNGSGLILWPCQGTPNEVWYQTL